MRCLVAALLLAVACTRAAAPPRRAPPPQKFAPGKPAVAIDPAIFAAVRKAIPDVEAKLREGVDEAGFPSVSVGLVAGGELVWRGSFGEAAHAEPVFRLGSITKVFTALAILSLRDAGKLSLDEPAVTYLPELAEVVYPTRDSPPITVRHLVTHTSGLPLLGAVGLEGADEQKLLGAVQGLKLEFAPGSRVQYSNLAFALAGLLVARVSGESYRDYVTTHILAPLSMRETVWEPGSLAPRVPPGHTTTAGAPHKRERQVVLGAMEPAGGLYSTVADMARFMLWELGAEPPRDDLDGGPVSRATLRESQRVAGHSPGGAETFGVGWVVLSDPALGRVVFHNGSTGDYSASLWLLPERGIGLIAFTNAGLSGPLDRVSREALVTLVEKLPQPVPVLGAPTRAALERVKKFLALPDAVSAEAVFTEGFLEQVPVAELVTTTQQLGVGACTTATPLVVKSSVEAVVRLECAGGAFNLYLHVQGEPPHKVDAALIEPAGAK